MKFIINETGSYEELVIRDINEIDWTNELIGNAGAIGNYVTYDEEAEAYRINQDDFDWWSHYIDMYTHYLDQVKYLYERHGESDVDYLIYLLTMDGTIPRLSEDYDTHERDLEIIIKEAFRAFGEEEIA